MERQVGAPSTPQRDLPPCGDGLRSLEMHAWWSPEKAEVMQVSNEEQNWKEKWTPAGGGLQSRLEGRED